MIIVDGHYERSSSSVEDEVVPTISANPSLLSPLSNNEVKKKDPELPSSPVYNDLVKFQKTETTEKIPIMVKIDLNRLDISSIPALQKRIEATRPWLLDHKIKKEERLADCEMSDSKKSVKESDNETKRPSSKAEQDHIDWKHKIKKRKRRNSSSSISSMSTVSNMSHHSRKKEHHSKKEKDNPKSKRRRDDADASRSHADNLSLLNAPPTNHEREAGRSGASVAYPDAVLSNCHTQPSREYHSYFEPPEEPSEYEERSV